MEIKIILTVLWLCVCMVFGYTLASLNLTIKHFKYWLLFGLLGAGYFIGVLLGAQ